VTSRRRADAGHRVSHAAGYDAGIVISASHNPFETTASRCSPAGREVHESVERAVEEIVADPSWSAAAGEARAVPPGQSADAYLDHLRAVFPESSSLHDFKLAIDCANGATSLVAPGLFASLGLDAVVIGNEPDGRNINRDCGSTHPEGLARAVVERGCHMGVAFDGDGDRAIFVDHRGEIVNGDAVLLMRRASCSARDG
jgi:phosphoglucosamine mutase